MRKRGKFSYFLRRRRREGQREKEGTRGMNPSKPPNRVDSVTANAKYCSRSNEPRSPRTRVFICAARKVGSPHKTVEFTAVMCAFRAIKPRRRLLRVQKYSEIEIACSYQVILPASSVLKRPYRYFNGLSFHFKKRLDWREDRSVSPEIQISEIRKVPSNPRFPISYPGAFLWLPKISLGNGEFM